MQQKYQVIARKFRPQTFAQVVGQAAVVQTLKNALRLEKLGAAYLFCGCRGTGKTTLARLFAKALNCSRLGSDCEPCNACPSCVEITSGHSLDVLEIDGASNRGIDDIRQINETVNYAPASGKYKIYLIDEVHMLTKEAFNALLKTLEEPPSHVKFFFATTEAHKVLPTILSRCQRFDLAPIPASLIKEKLKEIVVELGAEVEEGALSLIAAHSEGALRDAQSLLDQLLCYSDGMVTAEKVSAALGLLPLPLFFQLDQAITEGNLSFAFELSEKIYAAGNETGHFLEALMEHFRTLLQIKLSGKNESDPQYSHSASLYSQEECLSILDYLMQTVQEMGRTSFKRVTLEVVLLRLLRSKQRLSLDLLVKRLVELEERVSQNPSKKWEMPEERDSPLPFEKKRKEVTPAAPVAPVIEKVIEKPKEKQPSPVASEPTSIPKHKLETLMRFASVELEGTIKES